MHPPSTNPSNPRSKNASPDLGTASPPKRNTWVFALKSCRNKGVDQADPARRVILRLRFGFGKLLLRKKSAIGRPEILCVPRDAECRLRSKAKALDWTIVP